MNLEHIVGSALRHLMSIFKKMGVVLDVGENDRRIQTYERSPSTTARPRS